MPLEQIVRVVLMVLFAGMGIYSLRNRDALGNRPRRGAEAKLPTTAYVVLGVVLLVLCALQAAEFIADL